MKNKRLAVSIISGGMDSAVSSFMALKMGYDIIALHFNYKQRTENRELKAYREIINILKPIKSYEINLDFFTQIGANALTDKSIDIPTNGLSSGVPITYVPFRNGIFLSIATAIAEKHQAEAIFIGVVEEDSSGYPDCTDNYINNMNIAINSGTKKDTNIKIIRPLVHLKKSEIIKKGLELGVPLEYTWSCYKNEDKACGICESCILRLRGFKMAGKKDKIIYQK
jgi:7-cyano-7-deazaguanine synthase